MSKDKYITLEEVVKREEQEELQRIEDPGTYDDLVASHVRRMADSVMREGLTGLDAAVDYAMDSAITWQKEKNQFDEMIRSKAKPVKKKKKVVVKKKKAVKAKKKTRR